MENFEVNGTTLIDWTMRVQAPNEREALEKAQRIATRVDMSSSLATVNGGAPSHRAMPRDRLRG